MRLLWRVKHPKIVHLPVKSYVRRPPIRPHLRHTFEPRRIVLVRPTIQHVLVLSAYPQIDPTVIKRISVDVVRHKRVAGLQAGKQPRERPVPPVSIAVFSLNGNPGGHVPVPVGRLMPVKRELLDSEVVLNVD